MICCQSRFCHRRTLPSWFFDQQSCSLAEKRPGQPCVWTAPPRSPRLARIAAAPPQRRIAQAAPDRAGMAKGLLDEFPTAPTKSIASTASAICKGVGGSIVQNRSSTITGQCQRVQRIGKSAPAPATARGQKRGRRPPPRIPRRINATDPSTGSAAPGKRRLRGQAEHPAQDQRQPGQPQPFARSSAARRQGARPRVKRQQTTGQKFPRAGHAQVKASVGRSPVNTRRAAKRPASAR